MIIPQKRSLTRKIISGLAGLVLSAGCVTGRSVGAFVGYNMPIKQRYVTEYDSVVSYGVRGSIKAKNKIEVEAEAKFHKDYQNDGFYKADLNASDLSVGAVIPIWNKEKVEVYAVPKVISRSEKETTELVGIPASRYTASASSTGLGIGVGARFKAGKGKVDARLSYEEFGDTTYEESGLKFDVGYLFSF
jgi:hypothetical protein